MARRSLQPSHPVRWNFTLHILGGGALIMALQYGNVRLVLPWISQHMAVPYILIALLMPLYEFGLVVSQLLIAPHVDRVALRKHLVCGISLLLAGLFALVFVAAATLTPAIAAIAFLAASVVLGLSLGVYNVGSADLLAKTVSGRVRGRAVARQASLAGILILAITFALWTFAPRLANDHLLLLWLAVGAWIGVASAYGVVQELPSAPAPRRTTIAELRHGFAMVARHPWYKRFLIWRVLLLSVELALPFYAIHAASLHGATAQNLSVFVVAISLGLLVSGPLWGRLADRHTALAGMLGSGIAALAGALVLIADQVGDPSFPFYHAMLFFPLALAREGVTVVRSRRLSVMAPPHDRPAMVAYASALLSCLSIVVALLIGAVGHLHDIRTPLVILILLNIAAALYVPRAFADQALARPQPHS
jgi:MFS family permease